MILRKWGEVKVCGRREGLTSNTFSLSLCEIVTFDRRKDEEKNEAKLREILEKYGKYSTEVSKKRKQVKPKQDMFGPRFKSLVKEVIEPVMKEIGTKITPMGHRYDILKSESIGSGPVSYTHLRAHET